MDVKAEKDKKVGQEGSLGYKEDNKQWRRNRRKKRKVNGLGKE